MQSFNNKPQFGHWLIQQVDSGQYDGLRWLDSGKTTFRIPWKHNSRRDCNDEDNRIFREWAIVSGKIVENPNDKAKWKTNFRCALSSLTTQFERVSDASKDSDDPHKVYRIINPDYGDTRNDISAQHLQGDPDLPIIDDVYNLNPGDISPELDGVLNNMEILDLNPPQQVGGQGMQQQQWCLDHNLPIDNAEMEIPLPVPQNNPPVAVVEPYYPGPPWPHLWELEISIHYRRKEMLKTRVCAPVQLHYQQEMAGITEQGGQAVSFPSTEGLVDQKQIKYTRDLLESIQRGLVLEVDHTGVYGTRQDMCKVFTTTRNPNDLLQASQVHPPRKLVQNTRELLLSFEKFANDLRDFKENKRGSPDYTISLCFGEKYPDGKPLERKLIVVKVVPMVCRVFHEHAQMEGASSLNSSASLQISYNSLFDLINSTFSLPMQE